MAIPTPKILHGYNPEALRYSGAGAALLFLPFYIYPVLNIPVTFLALVSTIYYAVNEVSKMPDPRPLLSQFENAGHGSPSEESPETKYTPQRDHRGPNGRPRTPVSQPEGSRENPISISDAEDEDGPKTHVRGDTGGEVDSPLDGSQSDASEDVDDADAGAEVEALRTRVNREAEDEGTPAKAPNDYDAVRPSLESMLDMPLPEFTIEHPAVDPEADPCPPPTDPPFDKMDEQHTFYSELGWVDETCPKDHRNADLIRYIEQDLTKKREREAGILYVFKHPAYKNLYKVGTTRKTTQGREAGFPKCMKRRLVEKHATKKARGAGRAEMLAHLHMATGAVDLRTCLHCTSTRDGTKYHTEWFAGDVEDMKKCVDFWARFVDTWYNKEGVFTGDIRKISSFVLSSGKKPRESSLGAGAGDDPAQSPTLRPRRGQRMRAASTGCVDPGEEDEPGHVDEASIAVRQLWEARPNPAGSRGMYTPPKKAPRTRSGGGSGAQTRRAVLGRKDANVRIGASKEVPVVV